ncbi:hypothetical protein FQR65_LT08717 [Abscondita terminalis]|nr:hypothetical protein FQR65_LT08717 [Abscondita terminalis]
MNPQTQKQNQQQTRIDFPTLQNKLKNLKLPKDRRDINILLLGETGVGKSTFINAFFNYIRFSKFWTARNEKLQVVIPTQFTVTDENYEERIVKVGEDHNESIVVGASATQSCRSYVYPVHGSDVKIRLIDTPGVGDTRGINQDNINFENILSFIGEVKYLNAICILLKPNNSRLTVMFEFCIKQLLSRLEKSASQNLIFIFTNTRNTFYRPGETLPLLKQLLTTVKDVEILCERKNIFCTDNESFRFLAAVKNNIRFSTADVNNFSKSWSQSFGECLRMITYIVGDECNPGLVPHEVKNTISVNEARRLVVQLSQPLAEIAQLIDDNIRAIDSHRSHLKQENITLSILKSKLYIPTVDLKVVKLNQPTTVCTSTKCSTIYQIGGKKRWHYQQKCHEPCYLKRVPNEIIGAPELLNCAAMELNGECSICTCRFQVHMHIYYRTEIFENKVEDNTIKNNISSKEEARKNAQDLEVKMVKRLDLLNREKYAITKTTAKFACFLKTNAIAPYNDAYEAYLEYLIDREKSLNDATDFEVIKQLQKMLSEYKEEKAVIMKAISEANDNTNTLIKANDILKTIKSLYSLEMFGAKIKELFEAKRPVQNENKKQSKELVYMPTFNKRREGPWRGRGRRGGPIPAFSNQENLQFSSSVPQQFQTDGSTSDGNYSIYSNPNAPVSINSVPPHTRWSPPPLNHNQNPFQSSYQQYHPPPLLSLNVRPSVSHTEFRRGGTQRHSSGINPRNIVPQPHHHRTNSRQRNTRVNSSSDSSSETEYFTSAK